MQQMNLFYLLSKQNRFASLLVMLIFIFCPVVLNSQQHAKEGEAESETTHVNLNLNLNDLTSEDEERVESADSVLKAIADVENLVKFDQPWKIKKGDDSTWASVDYDDSGWDDYDTDSSKKERAFYGIKWFRIHFQTDSTLKDIPVALIVRQFGSAADVYLDGKFLKSYGVVGHDQKSEKAEFSVSPKPFAFVFSDKKDHLFAIRYSDFNRATMNKKGFNAGSLLTISVKNLNEEIEDVADPSEYVPFIFFAAIFITLAVVHFIMFVFYRQKITNLYYSLYCLGIFLVVYYLYYMVTATDYATISALSKSARYLAPLLVMPLVAMLHNIFYSKILKVFWLLVILYIASLAGISLGQDEAATICVVILFFIAVFEILRVIVKALKKRKDGAWIFALVILLAPALGILSSFLPDDLLIMGLKIHVNSGAIVLCSFVLGLPFSMTLYLARDFARISKKLNQQLKEITHLSEKTIRQEQEKKLLLENQKAELEEKVLQRTQEVWEQKEVIELKNREITASLVYAKRIQSAILPDIRLIYKTLEQSFILYIPKDIVSGDFYGFAQKDGKVIIAAADCTGHGVSGAFMSMIGSSLLNHVINEKNITQPSRILDELNEDVITTLKQKESESNDGMDISICSFDLQQNLVEYAGANRPLWIIRNNELVVYRPDKFPIGGLQIEHQEKFNNHEIPLQKNDTIYLFSDGFADQFGGDRGKKMMVKRFKNMVLSIQDKSMQEQGQYLNQFFEQWKRENEQVDDVLVIGIRV